MLPDDTVLGHALGPISVTSPVDSWKYVVTVNDSIVSLTETLSNCQEQLRLAEQQLVCSVRSWKRKALSLSHGDSLHSDRKFRLCGKVNPL